MFSSCSGDCCICASGEGCLAGDGDDDFSLATKEQIIYRIDTGEYSRYTNDMKNALKLFYNYDYDADVERPRHKKIKKAERKYTNIEFAISDDGHLVFTTL